MKKLKILIIPSWFPNKEDPIWGNYFVEQATALSKYADVSMLYIERVGLKHIFDIFKKNNNKYPFKLYTTSIINFKSISLKFSYFLYKVFAYKAYKKYISNDKPDIILAQSVLPAGLAAEYISSKTNIPFTVHAHSVVVMTDPLYIKYVDEIVKKANGYFAVSDTVRNVLLNKNRTDCKLIPNFINTNKFNVKLDNKSDKFVLINVCNFFKVKALEVLLEAMRIIVYDRKIKNIKLNIVGTGEYETYYKKVCSELKLDDYVSFLGFIKNDELPKVYSKSNVVCVSSRFETFGIPIIEAMSCGIPCITTDCGGPSEIVNKKNGIIVPINDSLKYADAIMKMYQNYKKYDPEYIKKYVYDNYDEKSVCNKLIKYMDDIIKKEV